MIKEMFDYINKSVSPFHAVYEAEKILESKGFEKLEEMKEWDLKKGMRYYVTRNQSSIIAFTTPENELNNFLMTASHSDSPSFKVKNNKQLKENFASMLVEKYGGMIMSSWLDRPLSVAGRIVVENDKRISTKLVNIDKDYMMIPNLAIHFNREINDGYKYNPEKDMCPVYGEEADLDEKLAGIAGVKKENIRGTELYAYCRQKAGYMGENNEYYIGARIDDLASAFISLKAFVNVEKSSEKGLVWCMFDNEEVGSGTMQGAMGSFLPDVLKRIENIYGINDVKSLSVRAGSLLLSIDNAHAVHPNLPEKSDKYNPVYVNKGVVVKYNASQRYTTNAVTGALVKMLCGKAGVPVQTFYNRSDMKLISHIGKI